MIFSFFSVHTSYVRGVVDSVYDAFGYSLTRPITCVVVMFYFYLMFFICYSGHFSWNVAFGRVYEFVFGWAFISWFITVLVLSSQETISNVLNLHGEGYFGVLYGIWSKVISLCVRPLSLSLRLLINLVVGHSFMTAWCWRSYYYSYFGFLDGILWTEMVLLIIVIYEFFVFGLQSFIFARLLGIYLEEGFFVFHVFVHDL